MAYNTGVENFQIPYDRTFFDQLNAQKDGCGAVPEVGLLMGPWKALRRLICGL